THVDRALMVIHGRIAIAPRGSEQATDTVANGWGGILRTDAREISASIDDDVGVRGDAISTSIVGARLDESGIGPSNNVYVGYARGGRAVIVYARYRASDARKNGRKYRVGALATDHINYARRCNGGVAGGHDTQCALAIERGLHCVG